PDPSATPAPTAPPVAHPQGRGTLIVRIAERKLHDRYVRGAAGPNAFDCSGLVRYAYSRAGVSRLLGGGHSARAMYLWGVRHHLTSRVQPRVGDVVIWGHGTHAGIYIGNGRVISALNARLGIRITRLHALGTPFTTFIHTRI
ncbi:MAG: NlpC/P60 family protein, partial [Chloroflexota bacterium]